MDQNLSRLTKVGNWIATLLLGNTRELIIRIDERLSNFIVEMKEFKTETRTEFKEIRGILKEHGEMLSEHGKTLAVHTEMLASHTETLASHTETLALHTTILSSHTEAIAELKTHPMYQVRNSPTAPSEKGKKLLKDSGFDEIYPLIRQRIFERMEAKNLRTLYDYEKEAELVIGSFRSDSIMDRLKDYVVDHENEPLTLIFQIASWVVRDDYAKEHPLPPRAR